MNPQCLDQNQMCCQLHHPRWMTPQKGASLRLPVTDGDRPPEYRNRRSFLFEIRPGTGPPPQRAPMKTMYSTDSTSMAMAGIHSFWASPALVVVHHGTDR